MVDRLSADPQGAETDASNAFDAEFLRRIDETLFGSDGSTEIVTSRFDAIVEELEAELRGLDYRSARTLCQQVDRVVVVKASARDRKKIAGALQRVDARLLDACPILRVSEARRHRARMIGKVMAPEHLDRLVMAFNAVPPVASEEVIG